jgi:hypothetical protein
VCGINKTRKTGTGRERRKGDSMYSSVFWVIAGRQVVCNRRYGSACRFHLQRSRTSLPLNLGSIGSPELTARNDPEGRRIQLNRDRNIPSLKSVCSCRTCLLFNMKVVDFFETSAPFTKWRTFISPENEVLNRTAVKPQNPLMCFIASGWQVPRLSQLLCCMNNMLVVDR